MTLPSSSARVVNLRREDFDVYIGRAGHGLVGTFGNPYPVAKFGKRALELYRKYFKERIAGDPTFKGEIEELRGKRLGCFCKPKPCHGDVIVEYLDGQ